MVLTVLLQAFLRVKWRSGWGRGKGTMYVCMLFWWCGKMRKLVVSPLLLSALPFVVSVLLLGVPSSAKSWL
jgi:hypothetical protein